MEPQTDSTPSSETATPATEPVSQNDGTVQPSGEANGQGAPVEEGFTHVDPKTLPPQLRSAYDNMLRDYKEKTTKVAEMTKSEVAKAVSEYKQKVEQFDQIANQKDFVEKWNAYVDEKSKASQTTPQAPDVMSELQQIKMKLAVTETSETINSWADAIDDKGKPLHPDLDKYESLVIPGMKDNLFNLMVKSAPGATVQEKLDNGYKAVKQVYDSIAKAAEKSTFDRVNQRVRGSTNTPSSGPQGAFAGDPTKVTTAREARELAERGVRLH